MFGLHLCAALRAAGRKVDFAMGGIVRAQVLAHMGRRNNVRLFCICHRSDDIEITLFRQSEFDDHARLAGYPNTPYLMDQTILV